MIADRQLTVTVVPGRLISGIAVMLFSLFVFSSCHRTITPSGEIVANRLELSGPFDKVCVEDGITTRVNVGSSESSAAITCNSTIFRYLYYDVKDKVLYVRYKTGYTFANGLTLELEVNVPELAGIEASGGASVGIYKEATGDMSIVLTGGSIVRANNLNLDNLNLTISGGGGASLKGYAENGVLNCSGGSGVRDYDLTIDNLTISMSGGGNSFLTIRYSILSANLSGGSILNYKGSPTIISTNVTGGSKILKTED
ncbi:MAG: DUF2807 domain-containing protein [Bacteroidales bacterium]|nr:DUF2807 domain-containing protein [Bacteroidales bacterium]MDD4670909.1 DUF2807 domain-containing protein [Bacteroidales bacterium]